MRQNPRYLPHNRFIVQQVFYQFMDMIHLHMFLIESAGFFVLLMYERFGMGWGMRWEYV